MMNILNYPHRQTKVSCLLKMSDLRFSDVTINASTFYDINKMPDHRGTLFEHKHSKLAQLYIYDIDNELIPTYELSNKL